MTLLPQGQRSSSVSVDGKPIGRSDIAQLNLAVFGESSLPNLRYSPAGARLIHCQSQCGRQLHCIFSNGSLTGEAFVRLTAKLVRQAHILLLVMQQPHWCRWLVEKGIEYIGRAVPRFRQTTSQDLEQDCH